ncbi:interleukin 12 receptor, beta 2a, like isoform 2-T2 [Pholidichthys leucotaenia]
MHCAVDIQCTWESRPDPKIPTNYSLHWESANAEDGLHSNGTSLNEYILRQHFTSGELRVWVQARNQHGFAKSHEVLFDTEEIRKPPPPKIKSSHQNPLEIEWTMACGKLHMSIGQCDVRHRIKEDPVWLPHDEGFHGSYAFSDPQPDTVYEFQVRCSCMGSLKSEWSKIHTIKSAESAPVGKVNVWRECVMSARNLQDCFLTWKNLSVSQACGFILGFEVTVFFSNKTVEVINVSTVEMSSQYEYNEMKWRLSSSLKNVYSVSVSAYNALGATNSSSIVIPLTGEENDQVLRLQMNGENLTVDWDDPSKFSDELKEYVVEYKEVGSPPGEGFDWAKVINTTAFFKGQFKNYTAYRVSVFTISNRGDIRHLSSLVGYSVEKAPPAVPSFRVDSIAATEVALSWELIPIDKQNGLILYYQIGLNTGEVYNVSAFLEHHSRTFTLSRLSPGRKYVVWIRAVTAAGPGQNVTTRFTTKTNEILVILMSVIIGTGSVSLLIYCIVLIRAFQEGKKVCPLVPECIYEKVPDPSNSSISKQMKHQINETLDRNYIPISEASPKISLLEIMEVKPPAVDCSRSTGTMMGNGCSEMDSQDDDDRKDAVKYNCDKADKRFRKDYSKIIDSDEEKCDGWSSSGEDLHTSGYEKHFMPTALEVV